MSAPFTVLRGAFDAAVLLRAPGKKRDLVIGMAAMILLLVGIAAGLNMRQALPKTVSSPRSIATRLILLACISYQWMLFFARLTRRVAEARRHWSAHRYVGVAAILLFVAHAGAVGYAMISVMATGFLIVALTGLWNPEVAILRKPWLR